MPAIISPIFIIEEGTMHIHFNPEKEEYKAPDTPLNKALGDFNNAFIPLLHGDSVKQQRLDSLMRSELRLHGDDVLGMMVLAFVFSHVEAPTVASWLDLMSPRVKTGEAWNEMKMALSALGVNMEMEEPNFVPAIGEKFVDFAVEYNGKTTRLSDYVGKGQYVLVDFWASWCGPCRQEMPFMLQMYDKYRDKGLGILGVSLDKNHGAWTNAIKQLKLPWPQMSDLQGWQSAAAKRFNVTSIPHTIVVDQKGTILQRGLRRTQLEQFVAEQLK